VYYKGTSGSKQTFVFPEFTTDHDYCKIYQYEIDNNNNQASIVAPTGVSWSPACTSLTLCRVLEINTDVLNLYSIWIVVRGDGDKIDAFEIKVDVRCGLEDVNLSQPSYEQVIDLAPPSLISPYILNFVTSGIRSLFSTSLS